MSDLILGIAVPEITSKQAQAISMFAFKTAVITDRMMDGKFFDTSARYSFRTSLTVPPSVLMWLFGMHNVFVSGGIRSRNIFSQQGTPRSLLECMLLLHRALWLSGCLRDLRRGSECRK